MRRLVDLRHERGWSRRELAEAAGLNHVTIERIEAGEAAIVRDETRRKLESALGVPADDVLEIFNTDQQRSTTIYGLFDPDTNELRYIGQTKLPLQRRLAGHRASASDRETASHLYAWMHRIIKQGKAPRIRMLEVVPPDRDANRREAELIRTHLDRGDNLLNTTHCQEPVATTVQRERWQEQLREMRERLGPVPGPPGHIPSDEIVQFRAKWGISQRELSELIGYTNATISRWERGHRPVPFRVRALLDHADRTLRGE